VVPDAIMKRGKCRRCDMIALQDGRRIACESLRIRLIFSDETPTTNALRMEWNK